MKHFFPRFHKIVNLQCFAGLGALCVIAAVSLACRLNNYLPSSNDSNAIVSTANTNERTAGLRNSNASDDAGNLCNNSYYPIGIDLERKYRITYPNGGLPPQEYTESFSDLKADTFLVNMRFKNLKTSIVWRCTTDGLLGTQFDNNSLKTNNGTTAKIETIRSSGVSVPAQSRWRKGEKWNAEYDIHETLQTSNGATMGEGEGTVRGESEIIGEESVTVEAGTFEAMKVRTEMKFDLTVKVQSMKVPTQISLETFVWFVKDVGMVKSVTTSNGANVGITELLSTNKR